MASGLTYRIVESGGLSLKGYVLQFIPPINEVEEFLTSFKGKMESLDKEYISKREKCLFELAELRKTSDEDLLNQKMEDYPERLAEWKVSDNKKKADLAAYQEMKKQVQSINPGFISETIEYMIKQIDESIESDCSTWEKPADRESYDLEEYRQWLEEHLLHCIRHALIYKNRERARLTRHKYKCLDYKKLHETL